MATLKEGSLFSGYHGLGMGVSSVLDVEPVWFSEFDKGPSKILAHRFPGIPNHGDITKIDWSQVEPIDVLTGGSPCQDLSHAGKRAGMTEGTRSNLWVAMREAIEEALLATEPTSSNPTPPAHVLNPDGTKGKIGAYRCSYDYKRRVITRKVKELCGGRGAWKRSTVEQWLGFSVDEIGRCKPASECRCGHNRVRPPDSATGERRGHTPACTGAGCGCKAFDPWQVNVWPLIDLGFRREDTIRWFGENGHDAPPRSACWFCPHSRNGRWQTLKAEHPDLWERACQLDETIRNGGGFNARGNVAFAGKMFIHDSLIPLRDADLRASWERTVDDGQGDLFDGAVIASDCSSGVCFT